MVILLITLLIIFITTHEPPSRAVLLGACSAGHAF